jgi:predicted alpha/beta superfamily hydrolase/tetratricopeptide (TPR) repeat protein
MKNRITDVLAVTMFAILIVFSMGGHSQAQEDGSPVSIGTYRTLYSQILNEDRTVLVNLPRGYEETTIHYPVLYVLYGGQVLGYFAESVHIANRLQEAGLVPQLIVVGVKNVDRYRDNLPVNRGGEKGGAEHFLKFFTDELIPFVNESYRTEDFRILLGPQAGASFSLYTLMEQPDLFRVNIVTNPFWNRSAREYLLAKAEDFFSREGSLKNLLFVTCNTGSDNEATMEYLHRFAAIVEEGKKSDFTMILDPLGEKEADGVIPSPGLRAGLKTYFEEYKFPEETEIDGLGDLEHYYQTLSETYGYEIDIPEFTLVRRGGRLEERQKFEEARIMYEYVVKQYPHDLNSYHRLAELHRRLRAYDRSIKYYEEFLERRQEPFIEGRLNSLRRYVNESAAYAVEKAIHDSGTEAGITKYQEARSDAQSRVYFDENEFNSLGYSLIAEGLIEAAIEVFKMNVELNPQSGNAYDSLGEAYMAGGNKVLAIKNYRESLELNPDNANAREMLDKLETE